MDLLYLEEHLGCFNYDNSNKPAIEILNLAKGTGESITTNNNEIVFFLEGKLRFLFKDFPEYTASKGEIIFLPAEEKFSYKALSDCSIIIFRIKDSIRLCDAYPIENINKPDELLIDQHIPRTKSLCLLQMNPRVWYLLNGLRDSVNDGLKCIHYFNLKIKEFFFMLRAYYTKEEIHDFLYLIISGDTAFSEYIRLNWSKYKTVSHLAKSLNMSEAKFHRKFRRIFSQTPYQWMLDGKTQIIYNEIVCGQKPFKQIASENGFKTSCQFSKFCKLRLGQNPSAIRLKKK